MHTYKKAIFILVLASGACIDLLYANNVELTTNLRIPFYSKEKDERQRDLLNTIIKQKKRHRTDEQITQDRARLKELLDKDKHTPKELANLANIDEVTVRSDIYRTPELRDHPNLIIAERIGNNRILLQRSNIADHL